MAAIKNKKLEPADYIIAAGVFVPIAFDAVAWRKGWKTASVRFGEFLEDPKTRMLFLAGWVVLTAHLFLKLPLPGGQTFKRVVISGKLIKQDPLYGIRNCPQERG